MKIAQELFDKYEILAPSEENSDVFDQHTDCVDYCGFINAIAEHDKEILELIDEMIGVAKKTTEDYLWEKGVMDKDEEKILRSICQSRVSGLLELKQKIKKR